MTVVTPSSNLLAANQRLLELRATLNLCAREQVSKAAPAPVLETAESAPLHLLPAHLGWGSGALTAVLRQGARSEERRGGSEERGAKGEERRARSEERGARSETLNLQPETLNLKPETIKLYPDLAVAMLGQGQVAAGRVWLLLRHMDRVGCGVLRITIIRNHLTTPETPYYLCGQRQLNKLLKAGEGVFWQRDGEQLWLRSVGKVAVALGVGRLNGRSVALPVSVLLGGVGEVKAHFYASFHSGRKCHNPISRETLEKVTHVPARTQRAYDKTAGIVSRQNMAIGERYTAEAVQQRTWFQGTAVFDFIDHQGRQGPEKRHYVAWHLPNSYTGCHQPCSKGRQRKINRQIALVTQQARGNGLRRNRLFHPTGAAAARVYNRDSSKDRYWHQDDTPHRANGRATSRSLWWVLVAREP